MTENVKNLVWNIACGDIVSAKKAAQCVLVSDTAKKDEAFCKKTLTMLRNEPTLIQLPSNISSFTTMEDVSETFIKKRYFLTEREEKLFNEIVKADKVGHRLAEKRIRYLNATLLHGESGTGKTTFGKFVAHELGLPFLYLNFANLISSLLGKTGQNIYQVFQFAKQQKCVLMLDELDAIGMARGDKKDVSELSRVVITLMQSLDLLGNDIIVLAATNRYDTIDKAIIRRFTRVHEIKRLQEYERILLGKEYLTDCGYDLSETEISKIIGETAKQSDIEKKIIEYIIDREISSAGETEANNN